MDRIVNWSVSLAELANDIVGVPFEWGKTDCASVARAALVAMFGEDPLVPHIDVTYTTKIGAARAFKKAGSFVDIVLAAGAREIASNLAGDGDFMIFPNDGNYENVATRMGGLWIMSDEADNSVIATRILVTSIAPDVRVFRF
jgi:hypothetical protein